MENLLVSKCLFGENVRYDGGHCLMRGDHVARLKNKFKIHLLCPEVQAGMTIPREPIEFIGGKVINQNGDDLTSQFDSVLKEIKNLVSENNIKVALLKEDSPSCGSSSIYDGTFSGNKIKGEGIVTKYLRSIGVNVYSENEIEKLLSTI